MNPGATLEARQWRQFLLITAAALGIYAGLRLLPTGTNLSHMDFRVDPRAGNVLEFCDPANPQFIPVVAARSPVSVALRTAEPAVAGREVRAAITLRTSGGKPVGTVDLLVTHTRRLHLLIVDPSLTDYQHVHPEAGSQPGEWHFAFTPRAGGTYRVFADFTPAATGRGLYASADLVVDGPPAFADMLARHEAGGLMFELRPVEGPLQANVPAQLRFTARRHDQAPLALEQVMGAYAHLVAFDEERSGFAHLHPLEDETQAPDAAAPTLHFQLTIPRAGTYVIWAQIKVAGEERFVPFVLPVAS